MIAVLSWTASTFFTSGVQQILDNYVTKHANRIIVYFISCAILIGTIVFIATKYPDKSNDDNQQIIVAQPLIKSRKD